MANDKRCKGCQSFCMRGAQCGGQAPGRSTDANYSGNESKKGAYSHGSWWNWPSVLQGEGPNATTIQSKEGWSADNQNLLIQYIKDCYNEGSVNIGNLISQWDSEDMQKQLKRVKINPPNSGKPSYNSFIGETACSNQVIYAKHFNTFIPPLGAEGGSVVTQEPLKGEGVSQSRPSEQAEYTIVAGQSGNNITPKVKNDLIFAKDLKDLAKRAKGIVYHPYQCNICNVCEGSEWLEVVKATKEVHGKACATKTPPYDQGGWVNIEVNGVHMISRQDCSGFVSACLYAFNPDVIPSSAPSSWSTHVMGPDNSQIAQAGFKWVGGSQGQNPGDIQVAIQAHTQVLGEGGQVYNCGGDASAITTGLSSSSPHQYDGCWVPEEGALGGFSNGSSAPSSCVQITGSDPGDLYAESNGQRGFYSSKKLNLSNDTLLDWGGIIAREIGNDSFQNCWIFASLMANRWEVFNTNYSQFSDYLYYVWGGGPASGINGSKRGQVNHNVQMALDKVKNGERNCPKWVCTNDSITETDLPSNASYGAIYTGIWDGGTKSVLYCLMPIPGQRPEAIGGYKYLYDKYH